MLWRSYKPSWFIRSRSIHFPFDRSAPAKVPENNAPAASSHYGQHPAASGNHNNVWYGTEGFPGEVSCQQSCFTGMESRLRMQRRDFKQPLFSEWTGECTASKLVIDLRSSSFKRSRARSYLPASTRRGPTPLWGHRFTTFQHLGTSVECQSGQVHTEGQPRISCLILFDFFFTAYFTFYMEPTEY